MSWLDFLIIGVLAASVVYSFIRGVVREVFSFLAFIAGYIVAARVYGYGTPYLHWAVTDPRLAGGISFVAVFLTISFLVSLLGRILHVAAKKIRLSLVNRALGAVFGFLKGVVFVSVLLLFIPALSKSASQGRLLQGSFVAPLFDLTTEALSSVLPTKRYGALDNRLTQALRSVRKSRGEGWLSDLSRKIERKRASGPSDPGQTAEEEREIQKLLKQ